ncbi:hypothetical protein ABRY23_14075 [Melioribacteraceae bacterium 4301-Me]|uniref:hypothetical protein n=1 Tax=Pyranulibacter aquaticus TaxID=3163344 RepID=UPI003599F98F
MLRKIFLVTISIWLILNSCNSNPVIPPEIQPGRRDYVWEIDTLDMPMNWLSSIWGSSPQDVWAVGAGGTEYDRLWHYDGSKWSAYKKEWINIGGETLYGFSANDVWMGGSGGWGDGQGAAAIWHYDGSKWSKNFVYNVEGAYRSEVDDIWGDRPDDIYACGTIGYLVDGKDVWRGFILYYNGSTWKEIIKADFNSQFLTIRKEQNIIFNKVYVFALRTSQIASDTVSFYELKLDSNEIKEIYSAPESQIVFGNIHYINGKVYFLIGQDVYRYIIGSFVKQFSLAYPNFGYQFYGRNVKDIFLRMRDGLAHYNGTDIEYLYTFPLNLVSIIKEPMMFEKEIFFMLHDNTGGPKENLILHGKLK